MTDNQENRLFYRVISLLFVIMICVIIYSDLSGKYYNQNIRLFTVDSPLIFPLLVFVTLLICVVFELKSEVKKNLEYFSKSKASNGIKQHVKNMIQIKELFDIAIFTIVSIIYVYVLPRLHFIIGTGIYMFIIMILYNDSENMGFKLTKAALATIITIPLVYYVFNGIFKVILP